jgi:hypothetical protein
VNWKVEVFGIVVGSVIDFDVVLLGISFETVAVVRFVEEISEVLGIALEVVESIL